jgi:hypothetical protein
MVPSFLTGRKSWPRNDLDAALQFQNCSLQRKNYNRKLKKDGDLEKQKARSHWVEWLRAPC